MNEFSIYVTGASVEDVEAKVAAWNSSRQLLTLSQVEEADDYPGYTVAVDGWTALGTDERVLARELADYIGNAEPTWVLDERIVAAR